MNFARQPRAAEMIGTSLKLGTLRRRSRIDLHLADRILDPRRPILVATPAILHHATGHDRRFAQSSVSPVIGATAPAASSPVASGWV
jgi:hypothetical protein